MENNRLILLDSFGQNFTSFKFYNEFLNVLYDYYHSVNYENKPPILVFYEKFFIDPMVLPLLVGLGIYLKKHHGEPVDLLLMNNIKTVQLIHFLDNVDFFHIVGKNNNPCFPFGRDIFKFSNSALGGYYGLNKDVRKEHKLRYYSCEGDAVDNFLVKQVLDSGNPIDIKRDFLQEYFYDKISTDFSILFSDKYLLENQKGKMYFILSELVVNGIFHAKSDVCAMARTKSFVSERKNLINNKPIIRNTTFVAVSDVGIGFQQSLQEKEIEEDYPFEKFTITKELEKKFGNKFSLDLYSIFDVLHYSVCKRRLGLIDLIIGCFIDPLTSKFHNLNYFRLHNNTAQIIFSSKHEKAIRVISQLRYKILKSFQIQEKENITLLFIDAKKQILAFANYLISEFFTNTQTASLRLFNVEFPGVHIEMDITEIKEEEEVL